MTRHLLVAHGSPDPRHGAVVRSIAAAVTARGLEAEAAFLEHDRPRASDRLVGASGPLTVLGLLLSPGYHARVDVPRLIQAGPGDVVDRGVLGAGPWLDGAMDEVVAAVGGDTTTPVVVVSAGSTLPAARHHVQDHVARWGGGRPGATWVVTDPSDLSLLGEVPAESVVVPFLVAPGIFSDRIGAAAEGWGLRAAPVLGVTDGFIDAVIERLGASLPVG
jgi:sirohydrochlorin ferrochelatase